MKIKRYSVGGLHYVADLPSSNNTLPTQSNSKKEGSSEIDKALLNIIKEHGLTNDVTYFTQAVNKMLSASSLTDPFSSGTEYSMSQLLRVVDLANRVKRSNKEYETAVTRLQSEHAGNDIAVTNTGGLYVKHEGKLKTISAAEFSKNPDEYVPITTGDLLKIREYDPSLVYNTQILTDLSNQVGMKTIVDYIRTTINAFGKTEKSTDTVYNTKQMSDIEKGFVAMFGDHPTFKTTISDQAYTATATPEERQKQIAMAANYLWGTLNGNMKDVLQANAALNGRINKNSSPADILIQAINLHTDHIYRQDYTGQMGKNGKTSGKDGEPKQVAESFGNMVIKDLGSREDIGFDLGTSMQFSYPGFRYGHIENHRTGDQMLNISTLGESYNNLQGHGLVNTTRTVYFGDIPIQDVAATGQNILVDDSKGGMVVYLPTVNGNIDFNMMKQMSEIQAKIVSERITDPAKLQKIWEDAGYRYDAHKRVGVPIGYTLTPYWTQVAFSSTRANIADDKVFKRSEFLSTVDESRLERIAAAYNTDPAHKNNPSIEIDPRAFGKARSGLIYIPLNDNQNEVLVASGIGYTNRPNVDNIAARQQVTAYDPNTGYSHAQGYNSNILD